MSEYRTEEDTLGPVKIPVEALWESQTGRSRNNFPTGQYMPLAIIRALLNIRKAAVQANMGTKAISEEKGNLIVKAIDELSALSDEELRKDFPLKVYQTGSGTRTSMNTSEVAAHEAHEINPDIETLPNDDVNKGQSLDDTFSTTMNVVALEALDKLKPAVQHLIDELKVKEEKYTKTVKAGRAHLQDAVPLTFGQELSGYIVSLEHNLDYVKTSESALDELAVGGTAVDTGLNAAEGVSEKVVEKLSEVYGLNLTADSNKFCGLANYSGLDAVHGALKTLAADMFKLAQDIRFLAPGPRTGYGELNIPANEPDSSIMPGRINPIQTEVVIMAALWVFGNDTVVTMASSQSNFEVNVYKPVLIDALLESADLLTGTITGFANKMIHGVTVNEKRTEELVDNSLMTVTALSPHIGYHDSAKITQAADKTGSTLKEAALKSGKLTEEQHDERMDMLKMTNVDRDK